MEWVAYHWSVERSDINVDVCSECFLPFKNITWTTKYGGCHISTAWEVVVNVICSYDGMLDL